MAGKIVGIAGGSGSGKTTFAMRLLERLGDNAVLIAHDDYYKDLPDIPWSKAAGYDFDTPDALRTEELVGHLIDLKAGSPADIPSFDFVTHMRRVETHCVHPAPVIIVDGLFVMCDPVLRGMLDLVVFMDADADVRALRRIERDCRERGIELASAMDMYLTTVKPAHERYVEPYRAEADIVVPDALDDRTLELVVRGLYQK